MKKKDDKELKTEIKQVMKNYDEAKWRDLNLPHQRGLDSFMPMQ